MSKYESGVQVRERWKDYHVVLPDGDDQDHLSEEDLIFDSGSDYTRKRKAYALAELYDRTGGFSSPREVKIPVEVAVEGKPAISAYLWAVEGYDHQRWGRSSVTVEDFIGIQPDTFTKYIREFIRGDR